MRPHPQRSVAASLERRAPTRHVALVALPLAMLLLAGCGHRKAAETTPPLTVSVVTATDGSVMPTQSLGGYIAPLQNVTISSTLAEPASRVDVVEGDRVSRGELLAVFDTTDLQANLEADERTAAQADANADKQRYQSAQTIAVGSAGQARASLALAQEKLYLDQVTLQRDQTLLTQGFVARQTVDEQRETMRADVAAVNSAKAALTAAQITVTTNGTQDAGLQGASIVAARAAAASARAQADQIRAQISRATLRSPVDGIVVNRNLNAGEYPNSRTLFTVQQSGDVYAVLNASSEQITGIAGDGEPAAR